MTLIDRVWAQVPDWSDSAQEGGPATIKDLEVIFARIVSVIAAFAGIVALFALIAGGFRYISSGGDPKATAAARNTITYAFAGILLLIATWLILKILETITGVPLTRFIIYTENP